ncbi:hypothetical protein BJ122_102203 [Rhodopseudomonas faecalis]|uniref:Uncharacterized protein n=1 Tax=Rhodopseudomonas faecalis TaxID=99655 RepID=A0A318TM87_9BRAD|nr:hypothetical protein [Rhodopseudomonas faecalis]PYF04977.1 hypothetical protein BJ122_102203 [Rhodopseudomonas faecalis]
MSQPLNQIIAAIEAGGADETNGKPAGDIIEKGCEAAGYIHPADAANEFCLEIADAILAPAHPQKEPSR